jgi:hypothetical protein
MLSCLLRCFASKMRRLTGSVVEGCRKGRTVGVGTVNLWTGPRLSRVKLRSTSAISASAPHHQQSSAFVTRLYSLRLVLGISILVAGPSLQNERK